MTAVGAEKSRQCHKYFFPWSTLAYERPQVRIWGRQICFLLWVLSNLVTPLLRTVARKSSYLLSSPLEKCVGHGLKLLDTVQKIWAPLRKLFAPPGFTFVLGGLDIRIWQKFHYFIVFHFSIFGGLGALFGGAKLTKAPRVDGTANVQMLL